MDVTQLILTVLTSGVVAGAVTFVLRSRREDRLFRQQRLEELHEEFFAVSSTFSNGWVPFMFAVTNHLTYKQALIQAGESKNPKPGSLPRLQMLAALYHPKMLPLIDELVQIRDDANQSRPGGKY